jgi:hypothetical protein
MLTLWIEASVPCPSLACVEHCVSVLQSCPTAEQLQNSALQISLIDAGEKIQRVFGDYVASAVPGITEPSSCWQSQPVSTS